MAFDDLYKELAKREADAHAMGGAEKLERRKKAGVLNARERLDHLLDDDSFLESGLLAQSAVPEQRAKSPADGKIAGYGTVNGRDVVVVSNDFTVKGASSAATNMKKIAQMQRTATERGIPLIFLGESSGARIPDNMGALGMGTLLANSQTQYRRLRESPWAAAVLGMAYGSSSWYGVLSDFCVMRKGAVMAVSSERLVSMAIGEKVDPEKLGGWRLHANETGLVDRVVDTDEEALDEIKKFLSYLPSHRNELPPSAPVPKGSDDAAKSLPDLVPENRTQVYDMRKVLAAVADKDSLFEMKPRFGRTAVTTFARLDGETVGFIANNPLHKAGAMDAQACEKITDFMVLCDSYNVPMVFFVDNPGFVIGMDAERQRAPGKIMNFMNALQQVTVPKLTLMIRKNYGQAYINMGGNKNADDVAAWITAEVSFMDPAFAVNVVYGKEGERLEESDPDLFAEKLKEIELNNSVWDLAACYAAQQIIKPEDTRQWLKQMLRVHRRRLSGGIGQHLLANWPTSY
ncbi:MAG: methylmalonyl-CoA carboxyltransferase [Rhodospirillaceae bacterium]|nr:methylmalonyl-CoA carboxyltransferase [Rhodospirillaceae bacterium]HAA93167.1 methylmalonyl-CoA carboxyltransferase [Rhodospirillaceae bacterium]